MRARLATSDEWRSVTAETLEQLGVAAWEWDLAANEVWWSDNFGPMVGRGPGFRPSSPDEAFSLFHPADPEPGSIDDIIRAASAGQVESERRAVLPDGSYRWTSHRYFVVRDADEQPVRVCGLVTDIHDDRRREEQGRFVLDAAELLAQSTDHVTNLRRLAEISVPRLGDWCWFHLTDGQGLTLVAAAHNNPERARWAETMGICPAIGSTPGRDSRLVSEVTDDLLRDWARDEEDFERYKQLDLRSVITIPMRASDGEIGVMTLASSESRFRYDEVDAKFLTEMGNRIGAAVQNSLLHQQLAITTGQLLRLHEIRSRLSAAVNWDEAVRITLEEVGAVAKARSASFLISRPDSGFDVVAAWPPESASSWTPAEPIPQVLSEVRRPAGGDTDDPLVEYPGLKWLGETMWGDAWTALPIMGRSGGIGVVGLGFDTRPDFEPDQSALIDAIVDQAGVVLDRTRLLEQNASIARSLQKALMPEQLPSLEGARAVARYRAAGIGEIGGDWYDLFPTPTGQWVAVVGDVVGRGIPAVATMIQLRNALRAYMMGAAGPAGALRALNDLMRTTVEPEQRFATVAITQYDPATRELSVGVAGHPPPVYREPGKPAMGLEAPIGLPVGAQPDAQYEEMVLEGVPTDSLLVVVSDGWIERRTVGLSEQLELLRRTITDGPSDLDAVLATLEGAFVSGHDAEDDATALVIQFD